MQHHYSLDTDRLRLRQINPDDLIYLMNWRNQEDIKKWFFNTERITREQQTNWYKDYLNNPTEIMFMIETKKNPFVPIGTSGLYHIDKANHTAEFGRLMIGDKSALGKGLGQECVKCICLFGFNHLNLGKIYLEVYRRNERAVKIYESLGFKTVKEHLLNQSEVLCMVLEQQKI